LELNYAAETFHAHSSTANSCNPERSPIAIPGRTLTFLSCGGEGRALRANYFQYGPCGIFLVCLRIKVNYPVKLLRHVTNSVGLACD